MDENKGRIAKAEKRGTLPYFLKWNEGKRYGAGVPAPSAPVKSAKEIAKERHEARTQEQIDDIKRRYWLRWELGYLTDEEKLARVNSFIELEKQLGIKRGKPMNYNKANKGKENPHYLESKSYRYGYGINCQTCTMAHLLRRFGFNVSAMPNKYYELKDKRTGKIRKIQSTYAYLNDIGVNWMERFVDAKTGKGVVYNWSNRWQYKNKFSKMTEKRKMEFILESINEDGIYEIYCQWVRGDAHVFCAERRNGKLRLFDPQSGKDNVLDYVAEMKGVGIAIARIDNAIINPKIGAKLFAR